MRRAAATAPLLVALGALGVLGCGDAGPRVRVASLQDYGETGRDATAAIQAAIDSLGAAGGTVRLPAGTFSHRDVIHLRSRVTLEGAGDETVLLATDPTRSALAAVGATDVAVRDLTLASRATKRLSELFHHRLTLSETERAVVTNVRIEGSAAAGIFIHASRHVSIKGCTVSNTLADGIHTTAGSRHVTVADNDVAHTGDDAIAVVSYLGDGAICQDVAVRDNRVDGSSARGLAVVGGSRVSFERNVVAGTRYAGLYAASEAYWDTAGCTDIRFVDNRLSDVNRRPAPDRPYQGILLVGREGRPLARILVARNQVQGAGYRGLEVNEHVAGALIRDNRLADIADIGLSLGGRDTAAIGNTVSGAGAYGILVTETARGGGVVAGNTVTRPNTGRTLYVDALHLDATMLDWGVLAANVVRLEGASVERGIEVTPGAGRLLLAANADVPGERLVIGRPAETWSAAVTTATALPTSGVWRAGDVVLVDGADGAFEAWRCTRAGQAGESGGAAFAPFMAIERAARPVDTPE